MASLFTPQAPFVLHTAIEILAGAVFVLQPQSQLPAPDTPTKLVVQSLGGAVLFSSLVSLIFSVREEWDSTSRLVSLAFAFWHLWPTYRAGVRISTGCDRGTEQAKTLGGPSAHLITHVFFTVGFLWSATQ